MIKGEISLSDNNKIEEVYPNLFKIKMPFENSPLGYINSYFINGGKKKILIDTGFNLSGSLDELKDSLGMIKIDISEITDILLTHYHIDHVGLLSNLKKAVNPKILFSKKEAELLDMMFSYSETYLKNTLDFYVKNGVDDGVIRLVKKINKMNFSSSFNGSYRLLTNPDISLADDDKISVGDYSFKVILTPGHSPGHICLYEPDFKFLIAGDHILPKITPNVTLDEEDGNPLYDYFKSLDKIEGYDVKRVLPGHQNVFTDCHRRIQDLRDHHLERCNEILEIAWEKELNAYQIASLLHWNVNCSSWDQIDPFQKCMAIGETLAHLKFLASERYIDIIERDGKILYLAKIRNIPYLRIGHQRV